MPRLRPPLPPRRAQQPHHVLRLLLRHRLAALARVRQGPEARGELVVRGGEGEEGRWVWGRERAGAEGEDGIWERR